VAGIAYAVREEPAGSGIGWGSVGLDSDGCPGPRCFFLGPAKARNTSVARVPLRVVAGVAGGRRLHAPPGKRLRPTSERVREAIFASLGSLGAIAGARVLDLYAGTGALGIEALSRGAAAATFVEADGQAIATIRANLLTTGLQGTVVRSDVMRFLDTSTEKMFDVVLADPPYSFTGWADLLARLPAPLAVLESDRPIEPMTGWLMLRCKRYGGTVVTLARRP
jgi:16S rRNA (guanine966-N2)-methyltransferase